MKREKSARVCEKGHTYYKSSDCTSCPTCDQENKPTSGFLSKLYAPARRALTNAGIDSLEKLSQYTEKEILSLHGMGKTSMPILRASLEEAGLSFKE